MASSSSSRKWTPAEDRLLLELLCDHKVSSDSRRRYPDLSWRHIACCMNELTSSKGIAKLRLYDEAEVESRYLDRLQGTLDVKGKDEGKKRADEDMDMAKEDETRGGGKANSKNER